MIWSLVWRGVMEKCGGDFPDCATIWNEKNSVDIYRKQAWGITASYCADCLWVEERNVIESRVLKKYVLESAPDKKI